MTWKNSRRGKVDAKVKYRSQMFSMMEMIGPLHIPHRYADVCFQIEQGSPPIVSRGKRRIRKDISLVVGDE